MAGSVTKLGCRNGAASWAECSGVPFGRAGCIGASQSFGYSRAKLKSRGWIVIKPALIRFGAEIEAELERHRKGDWRKVKIARRLRQETTMTLKWIADRLKMGTWTHVAN
jgi:hypothetical protein